MPNEYYLPPNNPCAACGGSHYLKNLPFWEDGKGTTIEYVCPTTQKVCQVVIPPDRPAQPPPLTDTLCPVCRKANFSIIAQTQPRGTVVDQQLRCSNDGCGYEQPRRLDMRTGEVIPTGVE